MKDRSPWIFVAFAVLVLAAVYWWDGRRPAPAATKKPHTEVAIQDGKTIDFSSGMAVVQDDAKQQAALAKALREMESAVKEVTFGPPASGQKNAEPAPAPPKP